MKHFDSLPRRSFLRGLGTAVALPWLASSPASRLLAAQSGKTSEIGKPPLRMAYVYIPNGAMMADWTPTQEGAVFDLPATLQPLSSLRKEITVLSGLAHDKARANGDGAGDHARASATFLTAMQARKTQGADIQVGVSVDQYAAQRVGNKTLFPRSSWALIAVNFRVNATQVTAALTLLISLGEGPHRRCRRRLIPS